MSQPLWLRIDTGDFVNLSKAHMLYVELGKTQQDNEIWHLQARFFDFEQTIRSFELETDARAYMEKIMKLFPMSLNIK